MFFDWRGPFLLLDGTFFAFGGEMLFVWRGLFCVQRGCLLCLEEVDLRGLWHYFRMNMGGIKVGVVIY